MYNNQYKTPLKSGTYKLVEPSTFIDLDLLKELRKDYVFIWDFDGVLHTKPFSVLVSVNNVIDRAYIGSNYFYNDRDILLTGRTTQQREKILKLLSEKGYNFKKSIFRPLSHLFKGNPFSEKRYIRWKIDELERLSELYNGRIVLIDDNKDLIKECIKEKIKCFLFNSP
jgi:hypothetical protein